MASKPPADKPTTIQEFDEANVPPPKPDHRAASEKDMFAHTESMQKAKLGWVGAVWGSKSEKPGNIAAIVALVLLFFVGVLIFKYRDWDLFGETLAIMMSTITLILGYLFGSGGKGD